MNLVIEFFYRRNIEILISERVTKVEKVEHSVDRIKNATTAKKADFFSIGMHWDDDMYHAGWAMVEACVSGVH